MCEYCDSEETMMYCQDCGKWLCYDHVGEGDDVIGRPYVTTSGDLMCVWHGRRHDEAEEAEGDDLEEAEGDDLDFGWTPYGSSWFDDDSDLDQLEDEPGVKLIRWDEDDTT